MLTGDYFCGTELTRKLGAIQYQFSSIVWQALSPLQIVQFPWRFFCSELFSILQSGFDLRKATAEKEY
jgi:hypothetical protein